MDVLSPNLIWSLQVSNLQGTDTLRLQHGTIPSNMSVTWDTWHPGIAAICSHWTDNYSKYDLPFLPVMHWLTIRPHRLMKDLFLQNTASDPGLKTLRNEGLGHPTWLRTMVIKDTAGRRYRGIQFWMPTKASGWVLGKKKGRVKKPCIFLFLLGIVIPPNSRFIFYKVCWW